MSQGIEQGPPVPVGLEQLLLLAGVDDGFAEQLRQRPEEAAEASGVALTEVERALLRATPATQLQHMASQVTAATPEPTRRVFMGVASAAVVTLSAGGLVGCAKRKGDRERSEKSPADEMEALAKRRQEQLRRRREPTPPTGIVPGPRMSVRPPVFDGPIDRTRAGAAVRRLNGQVRMCWLSKGRPRPPAGRLRLDVTVDGKGKVIRAEIGDGSLQNNAVEGCLLEAARKGVFPPSVPKPTKISVRYEFYWRP